MTPKLRFPGFADEWQVEKLNDIAKVSSGGTPSRSNPNYWNGDIPWVTTSDIDFNLIVSSKQFISTAAVKNSSTKLFPKNTVLVAMYGQGKTRGKVALLGIDATTNQACAAIVPDIEKLSYIYLYQNLAARYDELRNLSNDGSQKNLSGQLIKSLDIQLPPLKEQRKIAGFLTVVDEKIANLEQKAEKLETYKRSVMQKLFTQKIHFKDEAGDAYAEWEERSLFEIADRVTERNKGNKVKGVLTNSAVQGIVKQNTFFDKDIAKQGNLTNYHIVSTDDFVYNPRISAYAPVGPIKRNHLSTGVMSPLYSVFRLKEGDLSFFEYYFETEYWHEYMRSIANSGARHDRMNITTSHLYELPLPYPCQEEQAKIANFLSAVDEKIELTRATLEKTKEFKKSLLQRMFV